MSISEILVPCFNFPFLALQKVCESMLKVPVDTVDTLVHICIFITIKPAKFFWLLSEKILSSLSLILGFFFAHIRIFILGVLKFESNPELFQACFSMVCVCLTSWVLCYVVEEVFINPKISGFELGVRPLLVLLQQHKYSLISEILVDLLLHLFVIAVGFVASDLNKYETVWQPC